MKRIGDYLVEQQLDAQTYLAVHAVLPRRARITLAGRERAVECMREACLVEALAHPGVPRVFECGLLPDRRPWLAVECVEGAMPGLLGEAGVVELIRGVADILDHAHRRGLVHGNVRPEAIVRASSRRGVPFVLLDWSNAHVGEATAADLVALGAVANGHLAPGALPRTAQLVTKMLRGQVSAAEVVVAATALADLVNCEEPGEVPEEVVLVDVEPTVTRMRWTPPLGAPVQTVGTPVATLRRR